MKHVTLKDWFECVLLIALLCVGVAFSEITEVLYIPALSDGSGLDAHGNTLRNPSGFPHNAFEGSIITYGSDTNDYAALIAHTNGIDGMFVKIDSGSLVTDVLVYTNGGFTSGQWTILDLWMNIPTDSGTSIELEYDADGSIQINADGSVELVAP